jgi:hypothetical protein
MSPLRRFQAPAPSCVPVAGAQLPFVESTSLQSVVCTGVPGLFGYPDPTLAASFPTDRCGLPTGTVPLHLSMQGSSSRELRSPSKSLRAVTCLSAPAALPHRSPQAPPVGFRPSSRHQLVESTCRRASRPAYVPPSAFRTLSTASSSSNLAHLFRCAAVSRVLAPGVSSHDLAVPPRRWPLPSRRWRRRLPVARLQRASRRPQGLAPAHGPQCPAGCLVPHVTRVPSCVFSSLGRISRDLGSAVALPPLAVFSVRCCVCPAPTTLSVSIDP